MRTFLLLMLSFVSLFGGISFAVSEVPEQDFPFSVLDLPVVRDVYRFDRLLTRLPYVFTQIEYLLDSSYHGAPSEEMLYTLDSQRIVWFLEKSSSFDEFYRQVRVAIVAHLLELQYPHFVTRPYNRQVSEAIIVSWSDFVLLQPIVEQDGLDEILFSKLFGFAVHFTNLQSYLTTLEFAPITIDYQEYVDLWSVYLFKHEQDIRDLWYELISWKTRVNEDVEYRRHNINAAFHNIGTVRLVMPGQTFSLAREFHYNPRRWRGYPYVDGLVTVGNGAVMMYGGGLCGVATALFQGILTNLWLPLVEYKAHSIYYRNLYEAEINGIEVKDPGLDATIFSPRIDLKFKNIREYPIILGFAFDGEIGSNEQVFSLSKAQDRGSFHFVRSFMRGTHSCFTWEVNGKSMTNCYRQVKNFNIFYFFQI